MAVSHRLLHVPHVPPLEHDVGPGPDAGLALRLSPSPHGAEAEPVHRVVVHLLVLVKERVVHRQLLLLEFTISGDIAPPLRVCPVTRGVGVGSPRLRVKIVQHWGRCRLHHQVISNGSILKQRVALFQGSWDVSVSNCKVADKKVSLFCGVWPIKGWCLN